MKGGHAFLLICIVLVGCVSPREAAKREMQSDRIAAQATNTVEAWLAFGEKYPDQYYKARKQAERIAYRQVQEEDTTEAFERYLNHFKWGGHAKEFRALLIKRRFSEAAGENTPSAYLGFANDFPDTKLAGRARVLAARLKLVENLRVAKTYAVEIEIDVFQSNDEVPENLRDRFEAHFVKLLHAAGLADADSGSADIIVRVEALLIRIGRSYGLGGLADKSYGLADAGAKLRGTTTIRTATGGRVSWQFGYEIEPPDSVQVSADGKLLPLGPHGGKAVFRRSDAAALVCWAITNVRGVDPAIRAVAEDPRLLPACALGLHHMDRESILEDLIRNSWLRPEAESNAMKELRRAIKYYVYYTSSKSGEED